MATLTTDAKPFSFHPTCQQCQYVGASMSYCPGDANSALDFQGCAYVGQGVHHHLTCSQCQFHWVSWTATGQHA